jgi:hypothetical protein
VLKYDAVKPGATRVNLHRPAAVAVPVRSSASSAAFSASSRARAVALSGAGVPGVPGVGGVPGAGGVPGTGGRRSRPRPSSRAQHTPVVTYVNITEHHTRAFGHTRQRRLVRVLL